MRLAVEIVDRFRTEIAVTCENSWVPYGRRMVFLTLTPEQVAALTLKCVGTSCGKERHEEFGNVWIEAEPTGNEH